MDRFNLDKGEKFNLTKAGGGASAFYVAIGWDTPPKNVTPHDFDVDVSAFGCKVVGDDAVLLRDDYFIFFNNLKSQDSALVHSGDNTTGAGDGDDEMIRIYTDMLDAGCVEIPIIADIHQAANRSQHFGMAKNTFIRVCKMDSNGNPGEELTKFKLDEDYDGQTGIHFGTIFKNEAGEWEFEAIGDAFQGGLRTAVSLYAK